MSDRRAIAQMTMASEGPVTFAVTKKQIAAGSLADLGALIEFANEQGALPRLVDRVALLFPSTSIEGRE